MAKAINHQFPHLRGREIELWLRFLAFYPDRFSSVEYDVRVGQGIEFPGSTTLALKSMAEALTRQRIDAVGNTAGVLTIIEIAPGAGTDSLGQLLVYRKLWQAEHAGEVQPALMLITDVDRPDIRSVATSEGVEMIIV